MSPCIHSNNVCARVGCLAAFQNRTDFFQDYPEDTCLAAMMTCNECKGVNPIEPIEDKGILEKIDRLVSEKISTIHVGVCRLPDGKHECPRMTQICNMIEERGKYLIKVDRYFASSKICSVCGHKKKELALSERTYLCECGNQMDRDVNAAVNILEEGKRTSKKCA